MDKSNLWKVPAGKGDAQLFTIRDASGAALAFAGDEDLAATVWAGDDTAAMSSIIALTHETPADGVVRATIQPANTAAVTPGYYRFALEISLGGTAYRFATGWLQVEDTAGSAAEPAVYCSLQDMLDLGGSWLPSLMIESGRTNFVAQRAHAREWYDKLFLSRCRDDVAYIDLTGPFQPWQSPEQDNQTIVDYLADDKLIVDANVIEANACKAIAWACETAITDEPGDPWPARAFRFHARARNVALRSNPGIDTDGDGRPDITVNLGYFSLR